MGKERKHKVDSKGQLRDVAETKLGPSPDISPEMHNKTPEALVHELQLHQIELEMQNEELRRVRAELDAARARYFDLYDLAPVGYFTISEQGLILEANLMASTLLSVSRTALIKRPLSRFVTKEDQDTYYLQCKGILNTPAPQAWDLKMVRRDGTQFWAQVQATAAQEAGAARVLRLAMIDITERKQAEEALRASETRYRRLFETAQDGVLILNVETGQIDDVNPFLMDMLGYTHEELMGKKLWEIGAFKNTEASKAVLAELQQKGCVRYEDLPLITKDGREIDVEFVSNVYTLNCHKVIQCNIRDITVRRVAEKELRRSQKLFHTIARVSPVGLFRADSEGQCVYVNEYWSEITGLSPGETYGEGWAKALHPADKERVLNEWHQAIQRDLPFESEFRFRKQGGIIKWVMGRAIAERGVQGEMLGYVGTITDITERKRMEEELQRTHDELEKRVLERTVQLVESNKSLRQEITRRITIGEELKESQERLRNLTKHLQEIREQERAFLSRELHDVLGQALTGMKMDIRWIERRLPEDSVLILERLHSMIMLIDDSILAVRRISMALRPPALDDFGLSEAIRLALTNFEKKTHITCKFTSIPHQIVLNREITTEAFRIFQEAFTNITRHADAKNVTIFLQHAGDRLIMEVRDDGRGITKKEIMDRKSIGLTGMRERAHAVGGDFAIIGVRGEGTTVTLSVPLNREKTNTKKLKRDPKKKSKEA